MRRRAWRYLSISHPRLRGLIDPLRKSHLVQNSRYRVEKHSVSQTYSALNRYRGSNTAVTMEHCFVLMTMGARLAMDRALALVEEFRRYAVHRLENCYFCRRTALEIVGKCEEMNLHVLGIDGYFLTDQITHQPIEWILDMSECPWDYDAARKFIESGAALPLFYEFVLCDPIQESSKVAFDKSDL